MAATITFVNYTNGTSTDTSTPGDKRNLAIIQHTAGRVAGQITFDTSYPALGYPLDTGLSTVYGVLFEGITGYVAKYDKTNKTVRLYGPVTGTEATTGANIQTLAGTGTYYFEAKGLV